MVLLLQKNSFESFLQEIVFFFLSVVFAGTIYVIPQIFLLKYYPESKNTFLTGLVVAGTIAAVMGVWMSNNQRIYKAVRNRKYFIPLLLIVLTLLFNLLHFINSIVLFLLLLVAVKLISNFIYNYLDISLSSGSTEQELKQHVKAVLLYQLLAYIIAPVYFSLCFFRTPFNILGVSLISIFSIVFLLKAKANIVAADTKKVNVGKKLDRSDWSFLLYSSLVQVGMMIISSLIIFILRDYYFYEDAVLKGGILVGCISLVSVVTIFVTAFLRKKVGEKSDQKGIFLSTKTNYIAMVLFFMSGVMLLAKLSNTYIYLLMTGTLTGVAYGLYLYSTRTYANSKASVEGKTKILVHYNNIANIGALISLSLVYIFTQVSNSLEVNFNKMILVVVLCIGVLCMAAIANYSTQVKKILREEGVGC